MPCECFCIDCKPTDERPYSWYARRHLVAGFANSLNRADCNCEFVTIGDCIYIRANTICRLGPRSSCSTTTIKPTQLGRCLCCPARLTHKVRRKIFNRRHLFIPAGMITKGKRRQPRAREGRRGREHVPPCPRQHRAGELVHGEEDTSPPAPHSTGMRPW